MNLDTVRANNKTKDLLLSMIKNCERLLEKLKDSGMN